MYVADWLQAPVLSNTRRHSAKMPSVASCCPDLTDNDLKELGITPLGHRRQLLKAIAALSIQGTPVVEPSTRR